MFSSCNSFWLEVPENTGKKDSSAVKLKAIALCEKVIVLPCEMMDRRR